MSLFDTLGAIWFCMLAIGHRICKRGWEAYLRGVPGDCRHVVGRGDGGSGERRCLENRSKWEGSRPTFLLATRECQVKVGCRLYVKAKRVAGERSLLSLFV
jgi:hypothetical protein